LKEEKKKGAARQFAPLPLLFSATRFRATESVGSGKVY